MPADATDLRWLRRATPTHQSGVFGWAGGVGAEVFGVVGEAESGLSRKLKFSYQSLIYSNLFSMGANSK